MKNLPSARTGSGLAGVLFIYVACLVAVTNAIFSAGVAATTHVPGGLARTASYSVGLPAGAPTLAREIEAAAAPAAAPSTPVSVPAAAVAAVAARPLTVASVEVVSSRSEVEVERVTGGAVAAGREALKKHR